MSDLPLKQVRLKVFSNGDAASTEVVDADTGERFQFVNAATGEVGLYKIEIFAVGGTGKAAIQITMLDVPVESTLPDSFHAHVVVPKPLLAVASVEPVEE